MPGIEFSALSERGLRTQNDDAFCAEKFGNYYFLFAIASGLASHPYGGLASMTALAALIETVKNTKAPARDILLAGIRKADAEVRAISTLPEHTGLTTKIVAGLIDDNRNCTILDIGNRNCTIITGSTIGHAADTARSRQPPGARQSSSAAPKPPALSDMISHVLGPPYRIRETDVSEFVLGDEFLLLSSDGLTGSVNDETIAAIVRKNGNNLAVSCEKLVQEAMNAGSENTITVVLVQGTGKT